MAWNIDLQAPRQGGKHPTSGQCVRPRALSHTVGAQQAQGEQLCLHLWWPGCIQWRTKLGTLSPSRQLHSRPQSGLGNSSWN